jgi:hypothetical protein
MTRDVVAAIDRRFQERREQVPLLRKRADEEGITKVRGFEDLVPVLFPHTIYKSYPESFVDRGKWKQLNRWLDSLSTHRVEVDTEGVDDVDGWIDRLADAGHFVSVSSGTTGKSSFLNKSQADRDATTRNQLDALADVGVLPDHSWQFIPLAPDTGNPSARVMHHVFLDHVARPDNIPYFASTSASTSGAVGGGQHASIARMNALRRAIADGTAPPSDIVAADEDAARRRADLDALLAHYADQMLEHRDERFFLGSYMALAWRFVEVLHSRGVAPGDLTGANALFIAGGTKGADLPRDHEAKILATLHVDPRNFLHRYSMQELNVGLAKCVAGRYHPAAEVVVLVLDDAGEQLAAVSDGEAEGRAAFFDFTLDGRWGGTISGDRVRVAVGACACGRPGPTVAADIERYANLADGDKVTCAGAMDAYVRGIVED